MRFQWAILQHGSLPLRPSGAISHAVEHRCTCTLLWPEKESPSPRNTVLADPCFTVDGYNAAFGLLHELHLSLEHAGRVFVTHQHMDHLPGWPGEPSDLRLWPFDPAAAPDGLRAVHCPGHEAGLYALVFRSDADEEVWVVGDAVLDEDWLSAWGCYWPNGYAREEIIETWRSVAKIVASADTIVPGHGDPIRVTPFLVRQLIERFPKSFALECPEVISVLESRIAAGGHR